MGGNFHWPQGEVILGAIGPENQRDFKVIGDSVNVSARLCSVAKGNEIVVYAKLADDAFGPLGTIQVKGRQHTLAIQRWKSD